MELTTTAQLAENEETNKMLYELGVDFAQEYGIHVSCPLDDIQRR